MTEMLRPESYGRYMDDFYLIHESKDYLQVCLLLIEANAPSWASS